MLNNVPDLSPPRSAGDLHRRCLCYNIIMLNNITERLKAGLTHTRVIIFSEKTRFSNTYHNFFMEVILPEGFFQKIYFKKIMCVFCWILCNSGDTLQALRKQIIDF